MSEEQLKESVTVKMEVVFKSLEDFKDFHEYIEIKEYVKITVFVPSKIKNERFKPITMTLSEIKTVWQWKQLQK